MAFLLLVAARARFSRDPWMRLAVVCPVIAKFATRLNGSSLAPALRQLRLLLYASLYVVFQLLQIRLEALRPSYLSVLVLK
jgi:hypothetical protein